jgi:hypothetical protein
MTFDQAQTKYPYRVSVRARNKAGWGEAGTTTASTFGLPTAPTSVTATAIAGTGRIELRWSGSDDNGTPIQSYVVRLPDGGELDVGNRSSFTFEGLVGGRSYTYQVRAVNSAGSSGLSGPATATATTPPGRPVASVAVTDNANGGRPTEITIGRGADVDNGGGGTVTYTWTLAGDRGDRASGTFTGSTATVDVSGWRLPFTGARVTATVTAGTALGSSTDDESTDVSWGQPPSAVQDLTITPDDPTLPTRVSAVWSPPANDGGIGVDVYRVCWAVNGVEQRCDNTGSTTAEQRLDRIGLPAPVPGDTVTVTVTPSNARGAGPAVPKTWTAGP